MFSHSVRGLGVHKIITFNQALLGKWLWRFRVEQEHCWQNIIKEKYGESQGDWSITVVRRPYGCNLWRGIQASWDRFSAFVLFRVGNGKHISFGMKFGVEIKHWRSCTQSYIWLQWKRMLQCNFILTSKEIIEFFVGTFSSFRIYIIGCYKGWMLRQISEGSENCFFWNPDGKGRFSVSAPIMYVWHMYQPLSFLGIEL